MLVDVIYPASEDAIVKDDDGPTEKELKTIEDLAYENSDLLDKDVAEFAHTIYSYLQGLSSHPSLIDTLWNDWIKSKDEAFKVASAYKEYVVTPLRIILFVVFSLQGLIHEKFFKELLHCKVEDLHSPTDHPTTSSWLDSMKEIVSVV